MMYLKQTKRTIMTKTQIDFEAQVKVLREVATTALAHIEELREAWRTGAIHERDNLGGIRSNRNVDVEHDLRNALEETE